jgi:hypothetical protein
MAEVWKKVVKKSTRSWGRGIDCLLECGHVETREVPPRLGRSLICRECSTPPRELPQLAEPLDFTVINKPRPAGGRHAMLDLIDGELRRLGFQGMVASVPSLMIVPGPPHHVGLKVSDPERVWRTLSRLEFLPTTEELGRICLGDSGGEGAAP